MTKDKYGIPSLKRDFPTEEACLEFLYNAMHSKECECGGEYSPLKGRKQYQCSLCRHQIAPMVGTIFEKSPTPLSLWFQAVLIFSNAKSGISAKEMARQLEVTYKCGWRILSQIRKALHQSKWKLDGLVEVDAGVFGGARTKDKLMDGKTRIIVAIQRDGRMKAQVVPDLSAETHRKFIEKHIEKGAILMTDNSRIYKNSAKEYDRETVTHKKKEWVRGDVHINTVESFFSHLKRSLRGTHKTISSELFQQYLDGFVFHRNNAHSDKFRFSALLGALLQPVK